MSNNKRSHLQFLGVFVFYGILVLFTGIAHAQSNSAETQDSSRGFHVDGQIALHSLMKISDAHLQKLADDLYILSFNDDVRSGNWERIRDPFAVAARMNIPAVHWFALPDGSYWTLEQGRATANLNDRAYFPRLLAGQKIMGDLVVSHATNRNTAIVAVPVYGRNKKLVGALGCSVHLDSLSMLIRQEMGGLGDRLLFFAIDREPLGALNSDPNLIFTEPMKLGDEGMKQAFRKILSNQEGIVSYNFRSSRRTVLYRKSMVTGWWYGFGIIELQQGALWNGIIKNKNQVGSLNNK